MFLLVVLLLNIKNIYYENQSLSNETDECIINFPTFALMYIIISVSSLFSTLQYNIHIQHIYKHI